MTNTVKLMSTDEIKKLIESVRRRAVLLDKDIQQIAIQAIGHSIVHRNIDIGMNLFNALSRSTRRQSLVTYLEKHGHFAWSKTEKKFLFFDAKKEFNQKVLETMLWYEAEAEKPIVSSVDVDEAVSKLIKKLESAIKDGKQVANAELLDAIKSATAQYHSKRVHDAIDAEEKSEAQ